MYADDEAKKKQISEWIDPRAVTLSDLWLETSLTQMFNDYWIAQISKFLTVFSKTKQTRVCGWGADDEAKKRISGWTDIQVSTPELYPSPSKILYSPGQTLFIQWDKTSFVKICHILPGRVLIYEAQITSLAFVVGIFIMQLFTRSLMMREWELKNLFMILLFYNIW